MLFPDPFPPRLTLLPPSATLSPPWARTQPTSTQSTPSGKKRPCRRDSRIGGSSSSVSSSLFLISSSSTQITSREMVYQVLKITLTWKISYTLFRLHRNYVTSTLIVLVFFSNQTLQKQFRELTKYANNFIVKVIQGVEGTASRHWRLQIPLFTFRFFCSDFSSHENNKLHGPWSWWNKADERVYRN